MGLISRVSSRTYRDLGISSIYEFSKMTSLQTSMNCQDDVNTSEDYGTKFNKDRRVSGHSAESAETNMSESGASSGSTSVDMLVDSVNCTPISSRSRGGTLVDDSETNKRSWLSSFINNSSPRHSGHPTPPKIARRSQE